MQELRTSGRAQEGQPPHQEDACLCRRCKRLHHHSCSSRHSSLSCPSRRHQPTQHQQPWWPHAWGHHQDAVCRSHCAARPRWGLPSGPHPVRLLVWLMVMCGFGGTVPVPAPAPDPALFQFLFLLLSPPLLPIQTPTLPVSFSPFHLMFFPILCNFLHFSHFVSSLFSPFLFSLFCL